MVTPIALRVCPQKHVIYFPAGLEDLANETVNEFAFCSTCECGTVHFVVVWPGDGARLMSSGGVELFERFEAQSDWPERTHLDENGPFFYREISNPLEITLFLKQ